ncbi:uncharacterized protein LOC116844216 isoform X4 [Odontomachus brunneus]|uniref:uncharacterized protein LOC116844216 isoform X4 n=1 Tax=Odontomachus brunneus TaxID=486640 RepID=UPI0013F29F79|nr:uncharacterized protein LOC116844216 isoform X4 [Odontomachus brunneus]
MASYIEITLLDAETNEAYKIVVSPEDAKRAESDLEFATKLLERARSNSRRLSTRMSEHKRLPKDLISQLSVVQEHRIRCGHEFEWDSIRILHKECLFYKRMIAEMIFIKMQARRLNSQTDTENLAKNITKRRGNLFLLLFLTHTGHFEGIRPEWPDRSQVRVPAYVTNSGCLR